MSRVLHHVAIGARDVMKMVAFYRDLLGLAELQRNHRDDGTLRSVWLDLGHGTVLMVEHTNEEPHRVWGVGAGPFLVAVRIEAGERAAMEEAFRRAGHEIEGRTPNTSYTRDPEGNRVAISDHPLMGTP